MSARRKPTVLVIDDSSTMTSIISAMLFADGYMPIISHSVEEALDGFSETGFSLVITDLFMEGVGGIEGISRIRKIDAKIPIIAISAGYQNMSSDNALLAAMKIGANAVLPKPFTAEELAATISNLLSAGESGNGTKAIA